MKGDMMNMRKFRNKKAQSAMEYLMTYGWAILIIAVVLGALFSLGVFSGASVLGTSCVASPGFLCSGLTYIHTSGLLSATIGQSTGSGWGNAIIVFAPQGSSMGSGGPITPAAAYANTLNAGLVSGQTATALQWTLGGSPAVGATLAGSIWACYTGAGVCSQGPLAYTYQFGVCACGAAANTIFYTQLATLTAKAT